MLAAIDAGNTRIKWGVHNGSVWVAQGALPTADAAQLADVSAAWPTLGRVVGCNVAGRAVGERIATALAAHLPRPIWLTASGEACGVRNAYESPERLGADRWAALIGARAARSCACLVVCAGTATTVDWLDSQGLFRGGLILPGFDLMRASLARNTAQLPLADGEFRHEPRNTMDAIVSGCVHAQIGAIERMFTQLADQTGALCVLTGGAAQRIAPLLRIPFAGHDNLILDGLSRYGSAL